MNTKTTIIGVVVILIIAAGLYFIVKSPAASSTTAPAATATTTDTTDNTSGATSDASSSTQVQAQDVTVGTGAAATPGSVVSVLYVGYVGTVATSTIFDSSAAHGNTPLSFTLGEQGLIPGFQIGVNGMKVGGERLMAIPPSLGYGSTDVKDSTGKVIIPGNSTIIFDVKLVSVTAPTSTATTATTNTKAK